MGKLWLAGRQSDWARVHTGERRRRVVMPTYPFERQRYWVERNQERDEIDRLVQGMSPKRNDVKDLVYQPSSRRCLPSPPPFPPPLPPGRSPLPPLFLP